jgi:hypothetical protein
LEAARVNREVAARARVREECELWGELDRDAVTFRAVLGAAAATAGSRGRARCHFY